MTKNTVNFYLIASFVNVVAFVITDNLAYALSAIWILLVGIFLSVQE